MRNAAPILIAFAAAPAAAAVMTTTTGYASSFSDDMLRDSLESTPVGSSITMLDFGSGITADVTVNATRGESGRIHHDNDGYGAFASHGDRFVKFISGSVTFDFSEGVSAFGFAHTDLESATLAMSINGGPAMTMEKHAASTPTRVLFEAAEGQTIHSATLSFVGSQGDGIGVDDFVVRRQTSYVPTPAAAATIAAAGLITARRRRD